MRQTYADPPRLTLPALADASCRLPVLPDGPTQADLEAVYLARGASILTCDAARQLATDTLKAERSLIDEWLARRREVLRPPRPG